ncbi:MAG TPA: hypothetical protein VGR37_17835 [Longimicrobiaceae bacterium]|nr:hypothetical protein [Longimicrobiaceae bacterium]
MPYREFRDEQGREWRAWDTIPQQKYAVAPEFSDGWICFESQEEKRRLTQVPDGWDSVPEERLCHLLRMADQVVPSPDGRSD